MTHFQFYNLFKQDLFFNILLFVLLGIIILKVVKIKIYTIFDPYILFYYQNIIFCLGVIIILFIQFKDFVYIKLLLSNSFVFLGIRVYPYDSMSKKNLKIENWNFFQIFYVIHTLFFLISFILIMKNIGFSAFNDKLAIYKGNGLIIYLKGLLTNGEIFCLYIKKYIYKRENKIKDIFIIGLVFLSILSGGSKASFFSFLSLLVFTKIYILYEYDVFPAYNIQAKIITRQKKYNLLLLVIGFFSLMILTAVVYKRNSGSLLLVLQRFVSNGDIYFLAYPHGIINHLPRFSFTQNYIYSLFSPFAKRLGLLPEHTPVLGYEIIKKVYKIADPNFGPNSRFDVMLQLTTPYYLNLIVCFLNGCLFAYIRNRDFFKNNSFCSLYLKLYFIFCIAQLFGDYGIFSISVFPVIFFFPIIYIITFVVYYSVYHTLNYNFIIRNRN